MNENALPVHHRLEVYERSFENDPSATIESLSPLYKISVGDYFDCDDSIGNWINSPDANQIFQVDAVRHGIFRIEKSHIGHTLMIRVELVQRIAV